MEKERTVTEAKISNLDELTKVLSVKKNNLNLRPIYHQKDESSDAHLFFGLLAYWVVKHHKVRAKTIKHKMLLDRNYQTYVYSKVSNHKCHECFRRSHCF